MQNYKETHKAECHVRIHDKEKFLMSMDLDISPEEVISALLITRRGDK